MKFSITEELADLMKRTITNSYLYEETKMVLQSLDIPTQKLSELVTDGRKKNGMSTRTINIYMVRPR
jgi:hypothetical protein